MNEEMIGKLSKMALDARKMAYVPYSHFAVGAALLAKDGRIFTGCNIENASFSPTICAERTAIFKAVSEGCRDFEMIAVCGAPAAEEVMDFCPPCGVCRQVMSEFCDLENFTVLLVRSQGDYRAFKLKELLPESFVL